MNSEDHKQKGEQKKSAVKVSEEQAVKEFNIWLFDVRRVKARLIDDKNPDTKEAVENVVANIMDGTFAIELKTGKITHKLQFPIGEEFDEPIKQLTYAPRMNADAFHKNRKFKNPDDNTRMIVAISTLSGKNLGLINKMEMSDLITATDLMYFYFLG